MAKSQSKVDLHWHVLPECLREGDDTDFWKGSISIQIDGIQTKMLNPADQILHLCVHGYRWFVISSIRWIADVFTILHSGAVVDWDRIILQANQRRVMLPVGHSLQYLRSTFGANIPGSVLMELNEPSAREIAEFQYLAHDHRKNLLGNFPVLWYSYNRNSNKPSLKGFVRYLQQFWNVPSSVLLPWAVFRKFILRIAAKLA